MRRAKAFGPLLLSRACAPQVQAGLVGAEYAVEVEAEALILPPSPPSSAAPSSEPAQAAAGLSPLSPLGILQSLPCCAQCMAHSCIPAMSWKMCARGVLQHPCTARSHFCFASAWL